MLPAKDSSSELVGLSHRPLGFMLRYVRRHPIGHSVILLGVIAGVACAVGSQYAVKHLVDVLSAGPGGPVWSAFGILAGLIALDNVMWRIAGWQATHTFVSVTGDLRRDLFGHLAGHSPTYFADRSPGTLAGRITSTSNAIYTVLSTLSWNVLPPCAAIIGSIAVLASVSPVMALALVSIALVLGAVIVRLAAGGRRLHRAYAADAASVDGELVDVINNMPLVRAFGASLRERSRFAGSVQREMTARGRSLRYLEKLRLFHAVCTALLSAGLLGWGIVLWQNGQASTGDVVLVSTMGFTILHGTRDLAVALVELDPACRAAVRGGVDAAGAARAARLSRGRMF